MTRRYEITSEDSERILAAVSYWFTQRDEQLARVIAAGRSQGGTRDAVVGGQHLDGFNTLVVDELKRVGGNNLTYQTNRAATLPGFYRAAKSWDLLVLQDGEARLAVEYKSMKGSEGKNLNNRIDEVLGVGEDLRQAQIAGLVPTEIRRAYVFIMEVSTAVTRPVRMPYVHGLVDERFDEATYLDRMGILCERVVETGLYDLAWAIGVTDEPSFLEPNPRMGWSRFADGLAEAVE